MPSEALGDKDPGASLGLWNLYFLFFVISLQMNASPEVVLQTGPFPMFPNVSKLLRQGYPQLHSKIKASVGHMRPCLKITQTRKYHLLSS